MERKLQLKWIICTDSIEKKTANVLKEKEFEKKRNFQKIAQKYYFLNFLRLFFFSDNKNSNKDNSNKDMHFML